MGAGRHTTTYLGSHSFSSAASSSSPVSFLNLPAGELGSVIFGCTHETYDECVQQLIFGLPKSHFEYIENVQPGMPLFLFNYKGRKLHGIFEAESGGELNINPYAWTNGLEKTPYPAQVRVRVRCLYQPLSEKVFRTAIEANYYYKDTHFYFELNHVQTDKLLSLFARNARLPNGHQMRAESGPVSQAASSPQLRVQSPAVSQSHEEGWSKPKRVARRFRDAWQDAPPFEYPSASTWSTQRVATPECWDDDYGDEAGETAVVEDPQGHVATSVDALPIEGPLDQGSDILPNFRMSDNGEDKEAVLKKEEREMEVLEKLRDLQKLKGKSIEVQQEVSQGVQGKVPEQQVEVGSSGPSMSSAFGEWEKLARLRCLQEQTMLREDREGLREKLLVIDAPLAKAVAKNLELSASAIAQVRQEEIKLRQIMDEALGRDEVLRELEQLKHKNAALEDTQHQLKKEKATLEQTQVRMAAELEELRCDVARLSCQLQSLLQCEGMGMGFKARPTREEPQESLQEIYLIGGHEDHTWLGSVDVFYPTTRDFVSATPMLTPRSYAGASVLMGSIYVFGGGDGRLWFETVESYDRERDEWIQCPPMQLKRGSLAGATVGDRIFALGGGNGQVSFSEVECYDPHLGMWMASTSMLNQRFGVAAAELNGALYAVGGFNNQHYLQSVERYDPREALWTAIAPLNKKRGGLSAVTMGEKLYAIGGYDGIAFLSSVELYEPRKNCWIEMETGLHIGRAYGAVAQVGTDLYMFGGLNAETYVDKVERFGENSCWEIVDEIALGRRCFLSCAVLEVDMF